MAEKKVAKMGWFSAKQAEVTGTYIYSGLCGGEVEVTCVSNNGDHKMGWDDVKFVGEVIDPLRKGRPAGLRRKEIAA